MGKLVGQSLNRNLDLYKIIATNIKHLRVETEKTQSELSELIDIGHDSWSVIESGESRIEFGVALAIANLFCLPSVECLSIKDFYKNVGDDWREKAIRNIEGRREC
jgi:DNA-binding XRE family transcriptional regulator